LWPKNLAQGVKIDFAYSSFKWSNLASNNAGVTVAIIGLSSIPRQERFLYAEEQDQQTVKRVNNINAYLVAGPNITVSPLNSPISQLSQMYFGNMPNDGGHLLLTFEEAKEAGEKFGVSSEFIRPF